MIIKMKKNVSKKEIEDLQAFLVGKNLGIKDASSDSLIIFGVIGDTREVDPVDFYAFSGVEEVTRIQTPYKKASLSFHPKRTIVKVGDSTFGDGSFTVIAGPCSVESYEQTYEIAKAVSESGVKLFRGGAFKPRTSPYSFQGLGIEGLEILYKVGQIFDLKIVSEIPSEALLPEFEKYVDIIQVGARNMQNFYLLKALGKSTKPILLKRGLSATVEELLMSAEYIIASGNDNVILCERGIRTFEKYTRNTLDISCVLAVKQLSHLPIIIDPSHAAGRFDMVERLSLASLAVGADGIIVEIHNDPARALSDGAQSLKLDKFKVMMDKINKLKEVIL
jgi:3-deoxy-7-phosphoheptulonate synthase